MSLRVATLNLWGRSGAWADRRPVLVDGLRKLDADLLAFQEAEVTDGYDQVADLLGPSYHLARQGGRAPDGVGVSIASRWPLGEVHEVDLHVVLAGDFDAYPDAASVRFWRGRQSLGGMSVAYRNAWEATHAGDPGHTFTPDNPLVPSRRNPLEVDGERPLEVGRRIDHIMVRCRHHGPTLDVVACERIFDRPVGGVWASDHFGVVADLEVP